MDLAVNIFGHVLHSVECIVEDALGIVEKMSSRLLDILDDRISGFLIVFENTGIGDDECRGQWDKRYHTSETHDGSFTNNGECKSGWKAEWDAALNNLKAGASRLHHSVWR